MGYSGKQLGTRNWCCARKFWEGVSVCWRSRRFPFWKLKGDMGQVRWVGIPQNQTYTAPARTDLNLPPIAIFESHSKYQRQEEIGQLSSCWLRKFGRSSDCRNEKLVKQEAVPRTAVYHIRYR
jgi:hypothetical protein